MIDLLLPKATKIKHLEVGTFSNNFVLNILVNAGSGFIEVMVGKASTNPDDMEVV